MTFNRKNNNMTVQEPVFQLKASGLSEGNKLAAR